MPDLTETAVKMLAGIRCQLIHEQIAAAWCGNCESWARTIGEPFWRPSLDILTARREADAETVRGLREAEAESRHERVEALGASRIARGSGIALPEDGPAIELSPDPELPEVWVVCTVDQLGSDPQQVYAGSWEWLQATTFTPEVVDLCVTPMVRVSWRSSFGGARYIPRPQ